MGGLLMTPPTGQQTFSQAEADGFLNTARTAASTGNPRVLGINAIPLMRAKHNGYPVDMYHPTLAMRQAYKEEEEQALAQVGYQRQYIAKAYPKAMFRRSMAPKFEPQFDAATGIQTNLGFVEEVHCRDAEHEKMLRAMHPKKGESAWFYRFVDIPTLDDGPFEDPAVTIARLQGQLAEARQMQPADDEDTAPRRGRGRPRKEEPASQAA